MSPPPRERWNTRLGLVLAMAGSAVGLGNFLRFPVQATQNGGGAFMVPYVIALLLLGLPMMWVEWGVGRLGGRFGHGTVPGMFDRLWQHPAAKYIGTVGLVLPLVILVYYTVIVGWLLGFSVFSLTGSYFGLGEAGVRDFLVSFQNVRDTSMHGGWAALLCYAGTLVAVVYVVSRGISGGIEKLALFAMPALFVIAILLAVRVLTLPATTIGSPGEGLSFMWVPQWDALLDARVWLAAAGQVFFTLSLGSGIIQTYASYLTADDDVTLSGLATAATNEFAEVGLGGTIAIPAAVTFFGVSGATALATGGAFDLGIVAMAVVVQQLPGGVLLGQLTGFLWFALLFIAGVTTSVALASPAMAFFREEFGLRRTPVALGLGLVALVLGAANMWWYDAGFLAEWDYWAGTLGLVVFACAEIWIIRIAYGARPFWEELHRGADLVIPKVFLFVLKWITPLLLSFLLGWWGWTEARPIFLMDDIPPEQVGPRWVARLGLIGLFALAGLLVRHAWRRRGAVVERPSDLEPEQENVS